MRCVSSTRIERTSRRTRSRREASRLENGSSSRITSGRGASALARATAVAARRTTRGGGAPPNRQARPTRDLADTLAPLTPGVESVGDIGGCGHMGEQGVVLEHHPHPAPLRRHVDTRVPRPCVHRRRPCPHRAARSRRSPAAPSSCHIRMGRADRGGRRQASIEKPSSASVSPNRLTNPRARIASGASSGRAANNPSGMARRMVSR